MQGLRPYLIGLALLLALPAQAAEISGVITDPAGQPVPLGQVTLTHRELDKAVREDERVVPLLLPLGDGLLVAVKR